MHIKKWRMEGSHTKKKANSVLKPSDLFTVNDENYTNWKLVLQTTKFFCSLNILYFITAKIVSIFPSLSAVQIYDFHVFTVVYSPLHGFIWNQHSDKLPEGLLGQLMERRTGIAEVMV